MNLETTYLGLKLRNPLIVGASPVSENLDTARKLEDAGAAAIVLHSLFEEQVEMEEIAMNKSIEDVAESHPEANSYFPNYDEYRLPPDTYVRKIERLKAALSIPVIGSLNGNSLGGWLDYARQMEAAGADALELNPYEVVTDPTVAEAAIHERILSIVRAVASSVKIPVAVKMSPFHASLANLATAIDKSGASGMVLFNRFYQPDFDIDNMVVTPQLKLSTSAELLLRLRWLSILSPILKGSLAASGGVHTSEGLIKAVLAGASGVQVVSVILQKGPDVIQELLKGTQEWMEKHEVESLDSLRGSLNMKNSPDPSAFERANYIKILQSWKDTSHIFDVQG